MNRIQIILLSLLLLSCNMGAKDNKGTDKKYANGLFNMGDLRTIEIQMPDSTWQNILAHPYKKDYHICSVSINGEHLDSVAIRTKGASSLDDVRSMKSDRYSFTLDLNKYKKGQKYHKLTKLLLNNNIWDATQMKDAIVYDMSRFMGLPAPLTNYAKIMVNGHLQGYYLMVEAVDKHFCKRNYPNEKSNIYKPYHNLAYNGEDLKAYGDIEREARIGGDENSLRNVIAALKSVDQGVDIEQHVDVESIMKYMALQTMAVNFDSMTGHNVQNFYLHEGNGKISIIPWDYNLAWGGYQDDEGDMDFGDFDPSKMGDFDPSKWEEGMGFGTMNISKPGEDLGQGTPEEMSQIVNFPIDTPFLDELKKRTFFMNLLSNEKYKAMYYHYLELLCCKYIQGGGFAKTIKKINREIGKTAGTEPNAFYSNKQYHEAVQTLDDMLQMKAKSVLGQMAGTIPSTREAQKANPEKLINCDGLNLRKLGGLGY